MADDDSKFRADVSACATELNRHLPELARRHTPLALMTAMAEHAGGALHLCLRAGTCTPEQARAVLREVEKLVFE